MSKNVNEKINWEHLKTKTKHAVKTPKEYISAEGDIWAVGDINSNASGSGARANGSKEELDLVPVNFWLNQWKSSKSMSIELWDMLEALDSWQRGTNSALLTWLNQQDLSDAIPALYYGSKKYKAWNWAKGMAYSVSVGSLLRHTKAMLKGEVNDVESNQTHWSHILCNAMFLSYYTANFPELDDRPPCFKTK